MLLFLLAKPTVEANCLLNMYNECFCNCIIITLTNTHSGRITCACSHEPLIVDMEFEFVMRLVLIRSQSTSPNRHCENNLILNQVILVLMT